MNIIKKETPKVAKELFKAFLFPCKSNKTPDLFSGQTWKHTEKKKKLIRSIQAKLCGLDCGQAGIVVVDFDTYKPELKKSKEAQAFFKECKDKSKFCYKTPSGGHHFFFKGKIKSFNPYPGVEIKAQGGYVCLYAHPAPQAKYEDWDSFYKDLPDFYFTDWGQKQKEHRNFGQGKNNRAIPQRAGKAGATASLTKATKDIIEMFSNNRNNPDWNKEKDVSDYLNVLQRNWTPIPDNPPVATPVLPSNKKSQLQKNIPILSESLTGVSPLSIKYLDPHNMILNRVLIALAGPKGSLKSSGVIAYLLNETDARIGYFSDNEINKPMLVRIINTSQEPEKAMDRMRWLFFDRVMESKKDIWELLKQEIKKLKLNVIFEDPPYENEAFSTFTGTRHALGLRAKLAEELKVTWIVTRNFSKTESKQIINRVGGFALWSTIPRVLLMTFPAHWTSQAFKDSDQGSNNLGELTKLAKLHCYINNNDKNPKDSVLMKLIKKPDKTLIMDFKTTPRLDNPENWGKPIDFNKIQAENIEKQTREKRVLNHLSEQKDGLKSGPLKDWICKEFNISWPTATIIIRKLKESKLIEGGGSGPHSANIKITENGCVQIDD